MDGILDLRVLSAFSDILVCTFCSGEQRIYVHQMLLKGLDFSM